MTRFINYIIRVIKNIIKDFLNVYLDDENIREAYGDEYADRFSVVNPVTGKRKVSAAKILNRIFIVFILAFVIFIMIRMSSIKRF